MPTVERTCSECGTPLAGKSVLTRTCGDACRKKRSRRVGRANRDVQEFAANNNAAAQEVAAIVRREAPDVVHRVMREQLAPIVREALTEDVLRAVSDMVGLTAAAVDALGEDLHSEDPTVRQRAYGLVIKYTVGHPALVKPAESDEARQLIVNFSLPRPDAPGEELADAEPVEMRACELCGETKQDEEFVAGSKRCQVCFDDWQAKILAQFTR